LDNTLEKRFALSVMNMNDVWTEPDGILLEKLEIVFGRDVLQSTVHQSRAVDGFPVG